MEDKILVTHLRKNAPDAYSILFDKYFERLFNFAVHVVWREDVANDIVQEIFIHLYERSEPLNYDISLKSYLFNSVRNRCFNYLRDRKVEDKRMNLYAEACIWSENIDMIEEEEVLVKVREAMLKLPERCREICEMRFSEGLTFEEIAIRLGVSESTIRVQVARGIEKLRAYFVASDMLVILFFTFF